VFLIQLYTIVFVSTLFQKSVLDNPTSFLNPFQFEITFECLQELDEGNVCCCWICASDEQSVCSAVLLLVDQGTEA
jgi:hypothetical protein